MFSSLVRIVLCALMVAVASLPASALRADRQISQDTHSAWRVQDGLFSGMPQVIAQTSDGYLWIGTNLGLVRFDGVRFLTWAPLAGERLPDSRIFSLLGAHDGSLWIGTGSSVAHWKDGHLSTYRQITGRIEALLEDAQGAIWIARTQTTDTGGPVCRIQGEELQCFGVSGGLPFPNALQLAESDGGKIWVSGYSELCRWSRGTCEIYFPNTSGRPEGFPLFKAMTTGPDGSSWAAMDRPGIDSAGPALRLQHFEHGRWTGKLIAGIAAINADVRSLFVDRGSALWIGTAHHGVYRVVGKQVDHFGSTDGLSSDAVGQIYQDAEGTVWVVTSAGIDNFRDVRVASYSMREGISAASAVAVLAAQDGTLWVIDNYERLLARRGNSTTVMRAGRGLPGSHISTIFEDHAGRLWAGIDAGLWVYERGVFRAVRRPDGSDIGLVFAIAEDTHHAMWARAGKNLDRIEDYKLEQEMTSPEIALSYILAGTPDGGVVLGLVNGDLVKVLDGKAQVIDSHEASGNTHHVRDLLVEADGAIWGTTLDELFVWRGGVRRNLTPRNGLPCDGIFALVEDRSASIWLYSSCGLMRIARSELDRWWKHPDAVVKVELLDQFDGVQPGLTSLRPQATRAPDGRLWFANGRLLQMVDPEEGGGNALSPPVHIEQVVADRRSYMPEDGLRLPALTRDVQIDYTALSFIAPQKVQFRYRLEGQDAGWQDPGSRRQAFYNDLRPGPYVFRVIASNNDGVWNERGAVLRFAVTPAYYQTTWFRVICALAVAGFIWLLYLLRLRQVTEQIQVRVGARMEERERIARELHDTLLQGFQGLLLRFQAVMTRMPKHDQAWEMMGEVLDRADEVLIEGRERVRDLRSGTTATNELSDALARCGKDLSDNSAVSFSLQTTGTPRVLAAVVWDEAYRIGREALLNAFQHAQPSNIEVEIVYERARLRVRVRDDGKGMDEALLHSGRPGHWGLSGMRERAQAVGGQLHIWSNNGAGTEIELTLGAKFAYARTLKESAWQRVWRQGLRGRR